jgi:hypothetical protein
MDPYRSAAGMALLVALTMRGLAIALASRALGIRLGSVTVSVRSDAIRGRVYMYT